MARTEKHEMHWLTLAFHDPFVEQAFCIEQARVSTNVGFLGNILALATAATNRHVDGSRAPTRRRRRSRSIGA